VGVLEGPGLRRLLHLAFEALLEGLRLCVRCGGGVSLRRPSAAAAERTLSRSLLRNSFPLALSGGISQDLKCVFELDPVPLHISLKRTREFPGNDESHSPP